MGSTSVPQLADVPQHEVGLLSTRNAASRYFSFTTSFMFSVISFPLFAASNVFWFHHIVSSTALGIKKPEDLPQRVRVCRVPEERPVPAYTNEIFGLQLVEMMRKSGVWNLQFAADFVNN